MVQTAQNRNRAVDEVIAQLRDDSTNHTASMDSMRSDISNLQTSFNNIIHALSDLATKLGFQITPPPPLSLSRAPPTPHPVAAASAPTPLTTATMGSKPLPLPLSSVSPTTLSAVAAVSTTPSFPLDHIIPNSASPALMPTKSETAILTNRQPITLQPLLPTPNPSPSAQILRSLSLLSTSVAVPASKLTNNLPKSLSITNFSSTQTHSSILYIAYQGIPGAYGEAAISEAYLICKTLIGIKNKLRCESKVYIFDPGGLFDIVCIFDIPANCQAIPQQQVTFESDTVSKPEIRKLILQPFVFSKDVLHLKFDENYSDAISKHEFEYLFVARLHGYAQLNHNPDSTTLMPLPPASDLEDKVVFEGSVMIRYWKGIDTHAQADIVKHAQARPKRTMRRPARFLGYQATNE